MKIRFDGDRARRCPISKVCIVRFSEIKYSSPFKRFRLKSQWLILLLFFFFLVKIITFFFVARLYTRNNFCWICLNFSSTDGMHLEIPLKSHLINLRFRFNLKFATLYNNFITFQLQITAQIHAFSRIDLTYASGVYFLILFRK